MNIVYPLEKQSQRYLIDIINDLVGERDQFIAAQCDSRKEVHEFVLAWRIWVKVNIGEDDTRADDELVERLCALCGVEQIKGYRKGKSDDANCQRAYLRGRIEGFESAAVVMQNSVAQIKLYAEENEAWLKGGGDATQEQNK
jgi:hypothetical protein